jgi:hypothetical protein
MVLEFSGGTHDGSDPTKDIALGTKNIFGAANEYPWSSSVEVGTRSVRLLPYTKDQVGVDYNYDIIVEVVTACNGGLKRISNNLTSNSQINLDNDTGGTVERSSFTY